MPGLRGLSHGPITDQKRLEDDIWASPWVRAPPPNSKFSDAGSGGICVRKCRLRGLRLHLRGLGKVREPLVQSRCTYMLLPLVEEVRWTHVQRPGPTETGGGPVGYRGGMAVGIGVVEVNHCEFAERAWGGYRMKGEVLNVGRKHLVTPALKYISVVRGGQKNASVMAMGRTPVSHQICKPQRAWLNSFVTTFLLCLTFSFIVSCGFKRVMRRRAEWGRSHFAYSPTATDLIQDTAPLRRPRTERYRTKTGQR